MPELPEVRWLEKNLKKGFVGAKIKSMPVYHENVIIKPKGMKAQEYVAQVIGPRFFREVKDIQRRGKYILIVLEPESVILVHFKFTGWLIPSWVPEPAPRRFLHPMDPGKHTRLEIETDRGTVFLTDPRCLSRTWIYPTLSAALTGNELKNMGPDADTPEGQKALAREMLRTGRKIRDVIMDQRVAAGVGNYLCCEALFKAGLHGAEKAKTLTDDQKIKLIQEIKTVIQLGETHDHHDWWSVFRKKKCPHGHSVIREAWGTRGHYRCSECQKPPEGWRYS